MKLKSNPFLRQPLNLAALTFASLLGSAALSRASALWSDNFDSYSGSLTHQGASGGFGGSWFDSSGTSVSSGVVTGSGNVKRELGSTFGSHGTTIWLSFDWGQNTAAVNFGGLTFFEGGFGSGTERLLIGNTYGGETTWNMNGATPTGITTTGMHTGVAKITLSGDAANDTIELWVGPTGSPVDVSSAAIATSTSANLDGVDRIRIMGGDAQTFDNLLIGTTVADVDATDTPPAFASGTWTNTAGGDWGTTGNWSGGTVATGSGGTADFNTLNLTADTTVNLDTVRTIGNLIFGDTDTASAASWTLAGSNLTLAGTTPTVTVNSLGATKTATISAVIDGIAGLTKAGTGTLTLSGANIYSGATTVSDGTLLVSGQSYFNIGRTTTVASGAVFELNNSNNTFTTLMPTSTVTGDGTFRLSGNSTIDQSENGVNGTRLTFAMQAGGLIDLQGASRLVNGGWQLMNWTTNLADMNIASGATLDVWDGQDVIIDALTGSGTVDKLHGGNSPRLLKVGVDNGSGTFSGTIQNTGGQLAFTKAGTGTQILSGTLSYSGNTTVEDGTLSIGNGGSPTNLSDSATVSIAFGATMNLNFTGSDTVGVLEIDGSGPLPAGPYNSSHETYGSYFTGSGSLVVPVTATDYEIWADSFDPAIGLPAADDDNDGVTNFEEYAFGLIPNSGASVNPITAQLDKSTGAFSYSRRTDSGLTYSVWYSENLADWTEDTGATEGSPVPSGDNETVEVTLSVDPLPAKLFIQVRAD